MSGIANPTDPFAEQLLSGGGWSPRTDTADLAFQLHGETEVVPESGTLYLTGAGFALILLQLNT